jgi:hypothetical protein
VLLTAACRSSGPLPSHDVVVWRTIGSWKGTGPRQTEAFVGETGTLRIRWEATREADDGEDGLLRVTVHSAVSGRPLARVVEHRGAGQDLAYLNEDPRDFYVVVDSHGLRWAFTVEEGIPAKAPQPAAR